MKTMTASDRMNVGLERIEMRLRLRAAKPWAASALGHSTRRLNLPNRRVRDPSARWCGRGEP